MGARHTLNRPKRIWIFSEVYYPEETGTGHYMTEIAEWLAARFRVRVVASQPTYSQRGVVAPRREVHHGVTITRSRSTRFDKEFIPGRLANAITITAGIFAIAVRGLHRGDAVLVVTNPPPLPFAVFFAAWLRGAKPVLLVHDVYPEIFIATGVASRGSLLVRTLGLANRRLLRSASGIVVIGRDMAELIEGKLRSRNVPVHIISISGDTDLVVPAGKAGNRILVESGITDRFVVQFVGNLGRAQGLETMVEAADRLRDNDHVHFLFIGWGGRRDWLVGRVRELGLRNVTVLPPLPRSRSMDLHNACDVACIPLVPGMLGLAVPSKLYNTLASGRPVIAVADPSSELARVVREEGVGWIVEPGNAGALAGAILEACFAGQELIEMAHRARAAAESKYTPAMAAKKYEALFAELLESDRW